MSDIIHLLWTLQNDGIILVLNTAAQQFIERTGYYQTLLAYSFGIPRVPKRRLDAGCQMRNCWLGFATPSSMSHTKGWCNRQRLFPIALDSAWPNMRMVGPHFECKRIPDLE